MQKIFILSLLLPSALVFGQKLKKDDQLTLTRLQQHVRFLSDDKLQGRRVGTEGERMAADYISKEMALLSLTPKGTDGFLQTFEINDGKEIDKKTSLLIDGRGLTAGVDFFPLANSPDTSFEASPSLTLQEPGTPWFYDVKEILEENAGNPHFDATASVAQAARLVKKRGGTAIFLYNSTSKPDGIIFNKRETDATLAIPVIYLNSKASQQLLKDPSATLDIKLTSKINDRKRTGRNVAGFLDNGAPSTIVIGAHFDHLGHGEDGNSREVTLKGQIHNGADDNASGTAAVIELARLLKSSKYKHHNYLFLAFSGEELGLYGSKYFTEHPTLDLKSVSFMINMDMVGRLNDSTDVVTVGGYGTSPEWGALYSRTGKKKIESGILKFRFDSSGTGPSDHTSFYLKNIPVLFYFTGLHPDYHKPTDDFEKINFNGELALLKHILSLMATVDKEKHEIAFTKTRETQTTTSARFSVTLGIMPDYTFAGKGVRVDGVSDQRPGQKAGLKTGDVILRLGERQVNSLEDYMQALAAFKKGDKTKIVYQRGANAVTTDVEF